MIGGQPQLVVLPEAGEVAQLVAELTEAAIDRALAARGRCDLALAGGTTPAVAYELLGKIERDWSGVHLWLGDERCVPHDHPDSKVLMITERLSAPGAVFHWPPGEGTAEERASAYAADFGDVVLDLIHLGMGPDGHTLSMFPGAPTLDDESSTVLPVHDSPKPPPDRLTFSFGVARAAQARLLVVTGAGKKEALTAVLGEPSHAVPSSLLPAAGTTVACDRAAAP